MIRFSRSRRLTTAIVAVGFVGICHSQAQTPPSGESLPIHGTPEPQPRTAPQPPRGDSTIEGRLTDAQTGAGLPGVPVTLQIPRGNVVGETRTDGMGRYSFAGIKADTYFVEIKPGPAYSLQTLERFKKGIVAARSTLRLDWAIPRALMVRGVVISADSRPAVGCPITYGIGNGDIGKVTTNAQGRFEVAGIPPESQLFFGVFYDGQIEAADQTWQVGAAGEGDLTIKLCRAATISGKALRPDGKPMARATVVSQGVGHRGGATTTNEQGEFVLSRLYAGTHHLSVEPQEDGNGRAQRMFTLDVAEGESLTDVILTYNPAMDNAITWRVSDRDGNPLAGARASVQSTDRAFVQGLEADEHGEFGVHDLDQGTYYVASILYRGNEYGNGDVQGASKATPGESGVPIRIKLEPPRDVEQFIGGRVIAVETGRSVREYSFCANEVRGYIAPGTEQDVFRWLNGRELSVAHDSEGALHIPVYNAARYAVMVRAPGYAQWLGFLDAPATDVLVRLEPEAFAAGRVADSSGTGIAGAVIVFDKMPRPGLPPSGELQALGRTDADGNFELGGLPEGPVPLTIIHPEFENTRFVVFAARPAKEPQEIVMRRAGTMGGRVFLDGAPYAHANVQINFDETIAAYGFGGYTKNDGHYEIRQLSLGVAKVRAVLQSVDPRHSRNQEITVEFVEGEQIKHDFYFTSTR